MKWTERLKIAEEKRKKAIPSQVFYNHFLAILFHIASHKDAYKLKKISYYNKLKLRNERFDIDECRKLLWNSWSTEYAFNLARMLDNSDYYKFSLHWNFPQAYYSIYLAMTAFHETQGVANEVHEKSIKLFGNSIRNHHYPECISFFSMGLYNEFEYLNLPNFSSFPPAFSGLARINSLKDAQLQIGSFLKSTRIKNAKDKRDRAEKNNDKRFYNKKGSFRKSFQKEHWDIIYRSIPETTILNMLYRLRIKANYKDVESFINAEIDFKRFHRSLSSIVSYLNYIHEAYFAKVVGIKEYEKILNEFNGHITEDRALKRFEKISNL